MNHTLKYACKGIFPKLFGEGYRALMMYIYLLTPGLICDDNVICPNAPK